MKKRTNLSDTAITNVREAMVLIIDAMKVGEVYLKLAKYMFKVKHILYYGRPQIRPIFAINCQNSEAYIYWFYLFSPQKRNKKEFQEKRKRELWSVFSAEGESKNYS